MTWLRGSSGRTMANRVFQPDQSMFKMVCPRGERLEKSREVPRLASASNSVRRRSSIFHHDRSSELPVAVMNIPFSLSMERVNRRLNVSCGFKWHPIRSLKKMLWRCGLALMVRLTMVVSRIRANSADPSPRLVRPVI